MTIDRRQTEKTKEDIDIDLEKLFADWNLYDGKQTVGVKEKPIRLVKPE